MIKVLIADDSPVARELLHHILSADADIDVVAFAKDGKEAVELARQRKPDVITMDIRMPKLDGLEATRMIMETCATPIVVVSASWRPEDVEATFRSVEAGAVAIVEKPVGIGHQEYERIATKLRQTVKSMSEVKVITRRPRRLPRAPAPCVPTTPMLASELPDFKVVAIGVSTGGPPVLQTILSLLPEDFPVPLLIVQHIAAGFLKGMVEWLNGSTDLQVRIACDDEQALPGHAYFAPDGMQMGIARSSRLVVTDEGTEGGLRPSASYLFRSVADAYGENAVGVLLTGMGRDGAEELKLMKERGAVTIAQDQASSVVYGMPGEAARLGAATQVLPPEDIASTLQRLVNRRGSP